MCQQAAVPGLNRSLWIYYAQIQGSKSVTPQLQIVLDPEQRHGNLRYPVWRANPNKQG